jgi:protein-S-isoprenylcysteine O-methyltransferase Ste14
MILYAWLAFEVLVVVLTRTRRGEGKITDRGSMLILWLSIMVSITAATWMGESHPKDFLVHEAWVRPVALAILITGFVLRLTAILSLGKAFSVNVAIRSEQRVMKTGLYAWIRHPSYTGMLLMFFAVGFAERNWISLGIMLIIPTAALLYRIHVEEIVLREHFGDEYVDYSRETKRLVPGIY